MRGFEEKLAGVFAPLVTPFENGKIRYDALRDNVRRLNRSGLKGYLVLGTNGEFRSLTVEERFKVLETVLEERSGDKTIIAGTGAESTHESLLLSKRAAGMGVDFVSLMTPYFFAKMMNDETLGRYYETVAEAVDVPVMIYNNPPVTGITVSPHLIERLSAHPNIAGMKDTSKGNFHIYIEVCAADFNVLAGSADFFLPCLMMGGTGGVLSLANVLPGDCVRLYGLFREGEIQKAIRLQFELQAINREISGTGGVAAVKAAMDAAGMKGGEPREPLLPLPEEKRLRIEERIRGWLAKEPDS